MTKILWTIGGAFVCAAALQGCALSPEKGADNDNHPGEQSTMWRTHGLNCVGDLDTREFVCGIPEDPKRVPDVPDAWLKQQLTTVLPEGSAPFFLCLSSTVKDAGGKAMQFKFLLLDKWRNLLKPEDDWEIIQVAGEQLFRRLDKEDLLRHESKFRTDGRPRSGCVDIRVPFAGRQLAFLPTQRYFNQHLKMGLS